MSKAQSPRFNLEWYRKAAKKKLKAMHLAKPLAKLAEAQLAIAREHGFRSWRKLHSATEPSQTLTDNPTLAKAFAEALNRDRGDIAAITKLLDDHPEAIDCHPWAPQYPHTAIEAAAHLCVWHRPKMIDIVKLLLARGAKCDLPTVARAGLLDEVQRRLDADPTLLNRPDNDGRTAIYRAVCKYGFLKESAAVVQELLKRGALVDVSTASSLLMVEPLQKMLRTNPQLALGKDSEGRTALHWVTRTDANDNRQVEIARLLLDAGADPQAEAATESGMRPLHCAAEWASSTELAGLLIDRGANINATSSQSKWTPLDYALDRNREVMRDYLRGRGGKTHQELDAIPDADADAFLILVQWADIDAMRSQLKTHPDLVNRIGKHPQWGGRPQPLHVAIERGDLASLYLLIEHGANPDGDNVLYDHWSPLMLANLHKRTEMRNALLPRVNHISLIDALMMGDDARALRLLEPGAIALQRSMPNDATMLHFAHTPAAAKQLIELGVPIDSKDKYGKTPLDLAAEGNHLAMANFLLKQGAAASIITFAKLGDQVQIQRLIGKKKSTIDLLAPAIKGGHIKLVRWLIEQGVDVNKPGDKRHHSAARCRVRRESSDCETAREAWGQCARGG